MPLTSYYYNNVPYTIQGDLIEVSIENNVRILDLNDSLKISKNYNYFKDYGHLNKSGDEIIKQYLIESVIENSKP
jgi:lysophospholipase L1-like esterase